MSDIPHIRKLGRYLFYFPCALGFGLLLSISAHLAGVSEEVSKSLFMPLFFVAFLTLRDIEKNAELHGFQRCADKEPRP